MIDALLEGRAKYSSVFNYPSLTWADMGMIGWLVDGAAIINQTMLAHCSYGPYSRAMVRICAEETFHKKQGMEQVIRYARGTPEQKRMVQDALDRWWWPALMMFGPHDADSPNSAQLMRWGVKTKTNDELRQEFVNRMVPDLYLIGLVVPDPALYFDPQSGNWISGEIDWNEFWRVVKGNGPLNRERLAVRQAAHAEGQWVRDALAAYAARHDNEHTAARDR
jgi:ring-1,2-phenylacetyl-CoA epoxidase subunit PaaA